MSSAGRSGTSGTNDTERVNDLNGAMPDATDEALTTGMTGEEEPEMIEVVEYETTDGPEDMPEVFEVYEYDEEPIGGFRWWYVPAVAVPVTAATVGAIWYMRRRQSQRVALTANALTQQGRDLVNQARARLAVVSAKNATQGNIQSASASLRGLPDQASILRDKYAGMLSARLAQANDLWARQGQPMLQQQAKNAAGTTSDLRDRIAAWLGDVGAWETLATARDRVTSGVGAATTNAKQMAMKQQLQAKANDTLQSARGQAQKLADNMPNLKAMAATSGAKGAVKTASTRAEKATKKAQRSVQSGWRQARAFTFAVLVSATITYLRTYASRRMQARNNAELRETAGGRMVRDA